VESPVGHNQLAGILDLDDRALATSGGYGQRYESSSRHHLLSARNGQSHDHFALVSVRAPTAVEADALSTSLAVISPERVPILLRHFPGAEAFVVRQGDFSLSGIA
jgi:thiamine biosynthesis lipoprotein